MNDEILLGSHVSMTAPNYFLGSVNEANSYGSSTFMFYTGAPQNTIRIPTESLKIEEGINELRKIGINPSNLVVHAPYIINLANTTKPETFELAVNFLKQELLRVADFGIKRLVFHPGSAVGGDDKQGLDKIIEGLDLVLSAIGNDVTICLETMAGKGHELGKTFDELAYIIDNSNFKDRLGICLDTCHLNDAGYDVRNVDKILDEIDEKIGIQKIKVIHLNDSKNPIGSHKDRHENVGYGSIGFDILLKWIKSPRLKNIPFILETPWVNKAKAPYEKEIEMLKQGRFSPGWREEL